MRKTIIKLFILLLVLPVLKSFGQQQCTGLLLSNNVTSFPVSGYPKVFYSQFHPGIDYFREWKINKKEKNQFWLNADAGIYYHRFVQTAIRLYATVNYLNVINQRLNLLAGLGGGYLHSIENKATLKMNDEGVYEVKNKIIGRPQILIVIDLGGSYALKKNNPQSIRLQLHIRTYVQGVFVKGYVPFLPVNTFAVGVSKPLSQKRKAIIIPS
ncbi:MAG: hypothetical protein V1904_01085 [Bacteroidota bacterium]